MKRIIFICLVFSVFLFSIGCSKEKRTLAAPTAEEIEAKEFAQSIKKVPQIYTIEIYPIEVKGSIHASDVEGLTSQIVSALSNRRDLRVIDRSRMDDVMREHAMQQSVWAAPETTAEVGKVINANAYMYMTAITEEEISVEIEDVNTSQIISKVISKDNISELTAWNIAALLSY